MKGGGYKIIHKRWAKNKEHTGGGERAQGFFTDRVKVTVLPEKAKKLAYEFGELRDGLRLAFLEKAEKMKEDGTNIYGHYGNILKVIRKMTELLEPVYREFYLIRAEKLFRRMKNELPAAPSAYWTLGECIKRGTEEADMFVEEAAAAKNNEALPKICRRFG